MADLRVAEGGDYTGLTYGLKVGLNADARPSCVVLNNQLNLSAPVVPPVRGSIHPHMHKAAVEMT